MQCSSGDDDIPNPLAHPHPAEATSTRKMPRRNYNELQNSSLLDPAKSTASRTSNRSNRNSPETEILINAAPTPDRSDAMATLVPGITMHPSLPELQWTALTYSTNLQQCREEDFRNDNTIPDEKTHDDEDAHVQQQRWRSLLNHFRHFSLAHALAHSVAVCPVLSRYHGVTRDCIRTTPADAQARYHEVNMSRR